MNEPLEAQIYLYTVFFLNLLPAWHLGGKRSQNTYALLWDLCLSWRFLQHPDLFDGLFYGAAASGRRTSTSFILYIYMYVCM